MREVWRENSRRGEESHQQEPLVGAILSIWFRLRFGVWGGVQNTRRGLVCPPRARHGSDAADLREEQEGQAGKHQTKPPYRRH